jgi:hypothetical protein
VQLSGKTIVGLVRINSTAHSMVRLSIGSAEDKEEEKIQWQQKDIEMLIVDKKKPTVNLISSNNVLCILKFVC